MEGESQRERESERHKLRLPEEAKRQEAPLLECGGEETFKVIRCDCQEETLYALLLPQPFRLIARSARDSSTAGSRSALQCRVEIVRGLSFKCLPLAQDFGRKNDAASPSPRLVCVFIIAAERSLQRTLI